MTQKQHTQESVAQGTTPVERPEERTARRLRLRIEPLEARIAPDGIGDNPIDPPPPP